MKAQFLGGLKYIKVFLLDVHLIRDRRERGQVRESCAQEAFKLLNQVKIKKKNR